MRARLFNRLLLTIAVATVGASFVSAKEISLNGQKFTLPDGYEIELIAGPPLIDRPINADFDEEGNLYATESSGSNDPVKVQVEERPHRIIRLVDEDGDGVFDRRTVFADKLMFPEGCLWHDGSLYVAAPPEIWKFTDDDGDGKSDRREVWFDGKTLTNCANDLHGPYPGLDGWLYWCKGAYAEQTYERPGKTPLVTSASHIFRRHPDGGPIEVVMTGGMANPVDVVFTPGGEPIFTTTFLTRPNAGLRDGLIHAIHGGVYGMDRSQLDGHPRTGPLLPPLVHLGAAAPSGLERLQSDQLFPVEKAPTLMASLFNMRKITRHELQRDGATFASETTDFVVSESIDFHPTDVLEDADGSLIIVDTGGWYKLCCPTSQLWKPDVLGAIYRVRRTGSHNIKDARGRNIVWNELNAPELSALLADERKVVRQQAVKRLTNLGEAVVPSLQNVLSSASDSGARTEAVWALTRIPSPAARNAVRTSLNDEDAVVRQAALNSISLHRDKEAIPQLVELLKSESPHDQRGAAEALGRTASSEQVQELFELIPSIKSRELEHAVIYAAMEIGDQQALRQALGDSNKAVQRAALIALDQMEESAIKKEDVITRLRSDDQQLNNTAWWIVEQHRDWWSALEEQIRLDIAYGNFEYLLTRIPTFGVEPAVQAVLGEVLVSEETSLEIRSVLLKAMSRVSINEIPEVWDAGLLQALYSDSPELIQSSLNVLNLEDKASLSDEFLSTLKMNSSDDQFRPETRLLALKLVSAQEKQTDDRSVRFLCQQLGATKPVSLRGLAIEVVEQLKLSKTQQLMLADQVSTIGPMELRRVIKVLAKSGDDEVGQCLVISLSQSPSVTSLQSDQLSEQLLKFGAPVNELGKAVVYKIEQENAEILDKMEAVLNAVSQADIRSGQAIFHGAKASCSACHAAGYLGGDIGPGLMRIGKIRSERDLLESILFPSASFVQNFEPVTIATNEGRIYNGIVRDETADSIVLQLDAQRRVTIPVDEIEVRREGTVSIMPAGLDKQFTIQELADLVAFLKSAN